MREYLIICLAYFCIVVAQRDPIAWPFTSDSIWNMPIGSHAEYTPIDYETAVYGVFADIEDIFMDATAPLTPFYLNHQWLNRCIETTYWREIPFPANVVIPDAAPHNTPNGCGAFIMPDNRTIVQANPVSRCVAGGNVTAGGGVPDNDIYGNGTYGSRGGSGLSSLGGSLRFGELTGVVPIRHALKIVPWAAKYLNYTEENKGFRWPADRADSYASQVYGGKNPQFLMGSLVAIPPNIKIEDLNLTTQAASLLFRAFQDYGAYVVGDAYQDVYQICIQTGADMEFEKYYGFPFQTKSNDPWQKDIGALFSHFSVVTNNKPGNTGGGGSPRQPLAPPLPLPPPPPSSPSK